MPNRHARTPALRKASSFLQIRCGNFQNGLFRLKPTCSTSCHFKFKQLRALCSTKLHLWHPLNCTICACIDSKWELSIKYDNTFYGGGVCEMLMFDDMRGVGVSRIMTSAIKFLKILYFFFLRVPFWKIKVMNKAWCLLLWILICTFQKSWIMMNRNDQVNCCFRKGLLKCWQLLIWGRVVSKITDKVLTYFMAGSMGHGVSGMETKGYIWTYHW